MEINVNKDSLVNTGNNIIDKSKDFRFEVEQIKKLVQMLGEKWQGKDMDTFVEVMNDRYIPELENLGKVIESYGAYLLNVKKQYDKLDNVPDGGTYD